MSKHLVQTQLERYREGKLSAAELQTIDEHIGECATCRQQLNDYLADLEELTASLTADWPEIMANTGAEAKHLSYEQVAACVDGELQEENPPRIEKHLAACADCAERVQKLVDFRNETQLEPTITGPDHAPTFWQRLISLHLPNLPPLPLAPVAAAAALIIAIGLFFTWSSTRPPSSRLALNDGGGRVTLDEKGNIGGPKPLPPSYQALVKTALTTGKIKPPPVALGLFGVTGALRGGFEESVPIPMVSPVGTVVMADRPTFRWRPLSGAASYSITVSARGQEVANSPALTQTEWTVTQPLPRGATYTWQVSALKDGKMILSPMPPAPEARFRLLEPEQAKELELAQENYGGMHLVLGSLYARAGLLDDAEREFQSLVDANPRSPVARELLRNVTSFRASPTH
jgi:hypothetical protein